ncbi:MAG TPA: hypothetical protein VHV10_18885, partial [Ktedonobacteraceae bacterium]|nr:hypothetical protein [Ktedonobacteraceae bacterium]
SLMRQLGEAITATTSNNGTGGGSRTKTVISVEAYDLMKWINSHWPHQPNDSGDIALWARYVTELLMITEKINNLLCPTRKWTINCACPQCGFKMMYVYNEQNELVLRHTLLIDEMLAVTCQYCQSHWPRADLEVLAVALGLPPLECLVVR